MDFGNLLFDSPLICLATDNLLIGISEKLKFCQSQKKEQIIPPLSPSPFDNRGIWETSKLEKQLLELLLVLKTVFLKLLQNLQEITHYGE